VFEARFLDRIVETVDVVADERLTREDGLETGGNLLDQDRWLVETQMQSGECPGVCRTWSLRPPRSPVWSKW